MRVIQIDECPMDLDIRTMMVMTALLALLLSGLLALASLHSESIRGIRHWAVAELCIAISLGLSYTQAKPGNYWLVALGTGLMVLALNLKWTGSRVFCRRAPRWHRVWITTLLAVAVNGYFTILHPDITDRVVFNSLLLATLSAVCARTLLRHVNKTMLVPLWITAGGFLALTLMLVVRAGYVWTMPNHSYTLYTQNSMNSTTFFVASVVEMLLVIGFVLMMHYHIAHDLHTLAARDSLTGAMNRRYLEEGFSQLKALCQRAGNNMAVMMIDVDHFKAINDQHGHLVGDEVLRRLARLTETTIRKQDYFARYGGEEFCILMPDTSESEALLIAERLRKLYANTSMSESGAPWFSSISIGVVDSSLAEFEFEHLVAAADRALYMAKQTGRNRVVTYSSLG
jgi:diguanylate cyclase (GGDEF)-like protein